MNLIICIKYFLLHILYLMSICNTLLVQSFQKVELLEVANKNLIEIPDIRNYTKLKFLKANNNFIKSASFERDDVIELIDLSQNQIQRSSDVNVEQLTNLKLLNLSHNNITFSYQVNNSNLRILDLSFCRIEIINATLTSLLPSIEKIYLSHNPIHHIQPLTSKTLTNLDLSYTIIQNMNKYSFSGVPTFQILNMSHNKNYFSKGTTSFDAITIQELDVSFCEIKEVNFLNLTALRHLIAANNKIVSLENMAFQKSRNLIKINLEQNEMERISDDVFKNLNVRWLSLSQNNLRGLAFTKFLKYTKFLNISSNMISSLTQSEMTLVEVVDLSNNLLKIVPSNLNEILPSVINLNFSYNPIEKVSYMKSETLEYLSFESCKISVILNDSFVDLDRLKEINLRGNKLKIIFIDSITKRKSLKKLILNDNPWSCDCDRNMYNVYQHVKDRSLVDNKDLTCVQHDDVKWDQHCNVTWAITLLDTSFESSVIYIILGYVLAGVLLLIIGACCIYHIIWNTGRPDRNSSHPEIRQNGSRFRNSYLGRYSRLYGGNNRRSCPPTYEEDQVLHLSNTVQTEGNRENIELMEETDNINYPIDDSLLNRSLEQLDEEPITS